ncbi:MAG: PIG-L family deacetylase [Gemmatimonadota bacterium]|nr:PIG-L family deacetylase [Gemmatimonadota bacterium]
MELRKIAMAILAAIALLAGPADPSQLAAQVATAGLTGGQDHGLVGTALRLRQLDGVKRVLMIAAHPDDEDTSLLATLARGMGAETAYLSLSRGEGGQNLIGHRLHEGLGVIRTGELLAARALDGGRQYFTRAFDFGYSKSIDEALRFWPLDEVLRDVVFVVRKFRPHVIVSVFSGTPRDGHGQHQIAGVAAREAFAAAGDPVRYPELAAHGVAPWQPTKLYRSARFSPRDVTLRVPTGGFDPVLGRSHFQLAMESRSQHQSQDMGSGQSMGPRASSLQLVASVAERAEGAEDDGIFAGVDTTLIGQLGTPLPAGWPTDTERRLDQYRGALADAADGLSAIRPDGAVAGLAEAAVILGGLVGEAPAGEGRDVLERRLAQATETLFAAAGIVIDVRIGRALLTPGEAVVVDVHVWNGGGLELSGVAPELLLPSGWDASPTDESAAGPPRSPFFRPPVAETPADGRLGPGEIGRWSWRVAVPPDARVSAPWYLEEERIGGMYSWPDDAELWARPFAPAPVRARVAMALSRATMTATAAVEREGWYVGVDGATGEYRERVLVMPAIDVAVNPPSMVWPTGTTGVREVGVVLTNTSATARSGTVRLEAPDGWMVAPAGVPFSLGPDGASGSVTFTVAPTDDTIRGEFVLGAIASVSVVGSEVGIESHRDIITNDFVTASDIIDYPHIPRSVLVRDAAVRVSAFPVAADTGLRVGYVMGSGDGGPDALRQIGMEVEELGEAELNRGDFSRFDVLVLGVRAYETRSDLAAANDAVLAFAHDGGTVIVQYNRYEFPGGGFAPYPVTISRPHDRVTDETAPVTILAPASPVFSAPNAIGPADFEGWVQERGLYFLGEWDERYTPVMQMADPGEDPKRGGLLVAEVGEGLYVYTGLAFFRQFPAGMPGAYRLFANLVSMRAEDWRRAKPVS